jgi:hypothetical protein
MDQRQLDAKAKDHGDDQEHDKHLKAPYALHGPFWAVEEQDYHDVDDGNGASRDQRYLGDQKVQCNGKSNHLAD